MAGLGADEFGKQLLNNTFDRTPAGSVASELLKDPVVRVESCPWASAPPEDYKTWIFVGTKPAVVESALAQEILKDAGRLLGDIAETEGGWGTTMIGDKKVVVCCTPLVCSRHK